MAAGKRYKAVAQKVDAAKLYPISDAVRLVKELANTKFDETIDVVLALSVDPKQSDQNVRGMVAMPNGIGKTVRVAVFAKGDKVKEAKDAGADLVGAEDLVEQFQSGNVPVERIIATPDMMALVGRLGKVLGPKGLMPNPKLGTVTMNVAQAIKEAKSGQVEFKLEKAALIHAGVAKASFAAEAIEQNIRALVDAVQKAKPATVKGVLIKKISVSSTMGPGVKIDLSSLAA